MFDSNDQSVTHKPFHSLRRLPDPSHKPDHQTGFSIALECFDKFQKEATMSVRLRLPQTATPEFSSSTSPVKASDVDHRPDSLHQSELVYSRDAFKHSVAAASSLPLPACLTQSFTEKPPVWLSKETLSPFSQRSLHHRRTSSRAEIPVERRVDLTTLWRRGQPMPLAAMQDMSRPSKYQQSDGFENREHPEVLLTGAEWLDSCPGLHNYSQQQASTLPQSQLIHYAEPLCLDQPTLKGQILQQVPDKVWNLSTDDINGHQLGLQHAQGRLDGQGISNFCAAPPLPIRTSEPYTFPLTPPSSTRSERLSPAGEAGGGPQNITINKPHIDFDASAM